MEKDTYKTILKPVSDILFKERGSKFLGFAFPVENEEQVKSHLESLKKEHYNANHHCYAWQLGKSYESYRANDDGEPSNSAGMPILGQLQSFGVTNTLVVVVRYFGGTKLGVGGLIQAYRNSAKLTLQASQIVTRTINQRFQIDFDYPEMNVVMRLIKEQQLNIESQVLELKCRMIISIRKKEAAKIYKVLKNTHKVEVKKLDQSSSNFSNK